MVICIFYSFLNKANLSQKPTFFCWKKPVVVWVKISGKKKKIFRQANRKKLILPLENYFKTLNDMIIGTTGTYLFQLFTFFQSGWDNIVEIWAFNATSRVYAGRILRSILRLTIKRCPLLRKLYQALFWLNRRGDIFGVLFSKKCPFFK